MIILNLRTAPTKIKTTIRFRSATHIHYLHGLAPGTFLTTPSSSSIPTAVASGRRHLCSCLRSAIVRVRWLVAAFETVCHRTSPQLLL